MGKVSASVSPKSVAGHHQGHGWDFSKGVEAFVGFVRAPLERPSPVAAVYAVQKDHYWQVFCMRSVGGRMDRNIASLPQSLALKGDEADAIRLKARVGYFEGSERQVQCRRDECGLDCGKISVFYGSEHEFLRHDGCVHGGERYDRVGDLSGCQEVLRGHLARYGIVPKRSVNASWKESRYSDSEACSLLSQTLCETAGAPFGRTVDGFGGDASQAGC